MKRYTFTLFAAALFVAVWIFPKLFFGLLLFGLQIGRALLGF